MPPNNLTARRLTRLVGFKTVARGLTLFVGEWSRWLREGRVRAFTSFAVITPCAMDVAAATEPGTESPAKDDGGLLSNLSMDELLNVRVSSVYSASKHEQQITQAPAAGAGDHAQNIIEQDGLSFRAKLTC